MKKITILILILIFSNCNNDKTKIDSMEINNEFDGINVDPITYNAEFKYGIDSIMKIVYCNMNLTKINGTVWVSFKIDTIGNIKNIKNIEIRKSENEKLNQEAIRLTKLIPNDWKPAELGGGKKRVKVYTKFSLPIKFYKKTKDKFCKQ